MAPRTTSPIYPLYNTTFLLYRLNVSLPLDTTILRQHARRFRDILAGETLRGVRVNIAPDEDTLARVGSLQNVTWKIFLEEDAWAAEEEGGTVLEDATLTLAASRGIVITVVYEKATYTALLMRDDRVDGDRDRDGDGDEGRGLRELQRFPLLMTKMTPGLRETFIRYLTETFDVRISSLDISKHQVLRTLDGYIQDLGIGEEDETMNPVRRSQVLQSVVKDMIIVVGFDTPTKSLKTIDITIAREDLPNMVVQGEKLDGESPFFGALERYVKVHMALNLRHEDVRIVRIGTGAFVIGGGTGRIKITMPATGDEWTGNQHRANRRLIYGLIDAAATGMLVGRGLET